MTSEERELLALFRGMVNENRLQLIERIMALRTRYITVVLEDIYQPQNASAVLRTCDCLGIQDVHVIENRNRFEPNAEVELGSAQWLTITTYNSGEENTTAALRSLKNDGYRIVATTPHERESQLSEFDLSKGKTALLFGTEISGLSDAAMDLADEFIRIPMMGFTESFNISVSAAIILYTLRERLEHLDLPWQLSDQEKERLRYFWTRNSVKNAGLIERAFKKRKAK